MNKVDVVERSRLRKDIPPFRPGDRVKVHARVVEGGKERVQVFEGVVLGRRGGGLRETFTVRKISFGVGVERTFPVHSPNVAKLEVVRHGRVRRAKLYYLRALSGRHARIAERRTRIATLQVEEGVEEDQASVTPELADVTTAEAPEATGAQESTEETSQEEAAADETPAAPEASAAEAPAAEEQGETDEP